MGNRVVVAQSTVLFAWPIYKDIWLKKLEWLFANLRKPCLLRYYDVSYRRIPTDPDAVFFENMKTARVYRKLTKTLEKIDSSWRVLSIGETISYYDLEFEDHDDMVLFLLSDSNINAIPEKKWPVLKKDIDSSGHLD